MKWQVRRSCTPALDRDSWKQTKFAKSSPLVVMECRRVVLVVDQGGMLLPEFEEKLPICSKDLDISSFAISFTPINVILFNFKRLIFSLYSFE